MKIAIGFFGITRSLSYTLPSIEKNIYDILKHHNIEYTVFIHTYHLTNFMHLLEISKKQPLHSETVIGQIIHNHNINVIRVPFRFSRVRFNGNHVDSF